MSTSGLTKAPVSKGVLAIATLTTLGSTHPFVRHVRNAMPVTEIGHVVARRLGVQSKRTLGIKS
eukprot:3614348-Rhodomonas_salina.1